MNRRGNPNWGQLILVGPAVPTEFELQVRQLRLTPETYALSLSSAGGASGTGTDATSQNGCLVHGTSPLIQTSAPRKDHLSAVQSLQRGDAKKKPRHWRGLNTG